MPADGDAAARRGVAHRKRPALWQRLPVDALEMGAWHFAFVLPVTTISARGANRGIEVANRVRAPVVLVLCLLAAYAPWTGDGRGGLTFAFAPDFGAISPAVVLAAIGQAFYATGVGNGTSLVRSALIISGSTLVVSLLATVMT